MGTHGRLESPKRFKIYGLSLIKLVKAENKLENHPQWMRLDFVAKYEEKQGKTICGG
jgi:hypothetical protein